MADSKISALPASTTPLAGTEVLPIVQSGATKQVSVANLTAGRAVSASTLSATTGAAVGGATAGASGVAFPATAVAVANANTLDDYEEGTWTPVYEGLGGSIGATASTVTGAYTKIGRQVIANGTITLTDKGSWTSGVRIAGLPFAVGVDVPCAGPCTLGDVAYTGTNLVTYAIGSSTNFYIDVSTSSLPRSILFTTAVTNTSEFYFTVIYNT